MKALFILDVATDVVHVCYERPLDKTLMVKYGPIKDDRTKVRFVEVPMHDVANWLQKAVKEGVKVVEYGVRPVQYAKHDPKMVPYMN